MVVVVDDENRENEGDLTMAAQFVTPEAINFMAKEGRGLICLALTPERCDELGLDLMAAKNESAFETAFTVSIEAREGVSTGISRRRPGAHDPGGDRPQDEPRATSSSPATCSRSRPSPAACSSGSARPRPRVDLARLAGLIPAGVICEIMNDDGTMARVPDLDGLLRAPRAEDGHGRRPVAYRRRHEKLVERVVATRLPTGVRRVRRRRLPLARRQQAPRGAGQGRGRRAPRTCSSASTRSA